MLNQYFEELKNQYSKLDINSLSDLEVTKVRDVYSKLLEMSQISRTTGLPDLEGKALSLSEDYLDCYLKDLILLITCGYEPIMVEEMGLIKFFSLNKKGFEAVLLLMILKCVLLIQEGNSVNTVSTYLSAFFQGEILGRMSYE